MSGATTYSFSADQIATAETLFKTLFHLHDVAKDGVIPAIVTGYSPRTHYVSARPLVKFAENQLGSEEEGGVKVSYRNRPEYKVKAYQQRHGNFIIDFPLQKGDTGFIVAVDRNWSAARKGNDFVTTSSNEGPKPPETFETATFANGIFVPFSFTNDRRHTEEPNDDDVERSNRILEQPGYRKMIDIHHWKDKKELMLYAELQNEKESDESGSDSDDKDNFGTAGVIVGNGEVRIRGGGGEERPQSVWIGGEGTQVTNRMVIEGFPPESDKKREKHEEYEKVSGEMTWTKKATIDPVEDLRKSDAKFRPIYYLSIQNSDSDDTESYYHGEGESFYDDNVWLMSARVLSDIPIKIKKIELRGGGNGSGESGGGCDCDSVSMSASGECSVITDIEYASDYSESDIEPYTILVHKGKICVRTFRGAGRKIFQLYTAEDPERLLKIPTIPISEVVYPWALIGNTDSIENESSEETEPPSSIRMLNSNGEVVTLTVEQNELGENTIRIT